MFQITQDGTYTLSAEEGVLPVTTTTGYVVALGTLERETDVQIGDTFGRWEDSATGRVYWDRVTIIDDLRFALNLGRINKEIAIWDLENAQEIRC